MFIKKVSKRNGQTSKSYSYLHLVESVRTEKGPRQKMILNLGCIDLDPSQYKSLAQRIQDILTGEQSFIELPKAVEKIAGRVAGRIFQKRAKDQESAQSRLFENVDIESLEAEHVRSIGPEYVCHSMWKNLMLDEFFLTNGMKKETLPVIEALITGRLIDAGSELRLHQWATHESGLYELTGEPLKGGLNSFYLGTDKIFQLKDRLEEHLAKKERELFSLKEQYCLFDLTNTYFEGACESNPKAAYGRSKEKRSDCKIVTLGLVVDEQGFAKSSNLYSGNISEPQTLESMIVDMARKTSNDKNVQTVIMDAGMSTEENMRWLKEHKYSYITIHRGNAPFKYDFERMETIRSDEDKGIDISIKRYAHEDELYILCKSRKKEIKEKSMRSRIENLLVERLTYYKAGLEKRGRAKTYSKIMEMIGRLKEKYSKVAKLYTIEVVPEETDGHEMKTVNVKDITWEKNDKYAVEEEREGSYILKTDRTDLSDKEIWDLYIMLRRIEHSFLCMKSHLGLRPNFHSLERRADAHMFISVVAYHIMHAIEHRLHQKKDSRTWETIKNLLKTHNRITISFNKKMPDGKERKQMIRLSTKLEEYHAEIYLKLGLDGVPLPRKLLLNSG